MIVSEDQATYLWCPFSRVVAARNIYENPVIEKGAPVFNRIDDGSLGGERPDNSRCIASDCMAWQEISGKDGYGYCGLAGRPLLCTISEQGE
jgi:hypothetical protein